MSDLRNSQLAMARYLRNPDDEVAPQAIEPRRLKIYEDLVYNNIEGFLTSGFPVLYSLYEADDWRALVRSFMQNHRCHSPYFLEISQEFLRFLMEGHTPRPCDPPFMTELAHYEWVELALDVSQETLPDSLPASECAETVPHLSPLAWSLAYQFPVHHIGPENQPQETQEPTYLLVYRNRDDKVSFVALNAPTARLLELVRENVAATTLRVLDALAQELGVPNESIRDFGVQQVEEWVQDGVIWLERGAASGA